MHKRCCVIPALILAAVGFSGCREENRVVQRPEKVVSMREVVYDVETYTQLDSLWQKYNEVYPSEEAYANWMYAARYTGDPGYASLLEAGVKLYPANPRLLYLKAMLQHGKARNLEAMSLLERAGELDPTYPDPWFALVIHYLERGEQERVNVALRKILESGVIAEEVMDFSYNMLAGLERNSILVTNGDNDTYPGWILTRIVGHRPDVRIVNQSLLNTDWYLQTVAMEGVPAVTPPENPDSLEAAFVRMLREKGSSSAPSGPFSDLLIERLAAACRSAGRPLYFAATLQHSEAVKRLLASGRELGLVTLVTPPVEPDGAHLTKVLTVWLNDFRTSGLDGWELRYAKHFRAGKMLAMNYGVALRSQMDRIVTLVPDSRLGLFRWYRDHLLPLVPHYRREAFDRMWCRSDDIGEIRDWCRSLSLSR